MAKGLSISLEAMEEELCKDSRYYVLKLCIDEILEKSVSAADALDEFQFAQLKEGGA